MEKFGRTYTLTVDTKYFRDTEKTEHTSLKFTMPLTVEFDISRGVLGGCNSCSIRIYGLSKEHREAVSKNAFEFDLRTVKFDAGYAGVEPNLFTGNIHTVFSYRDRVNWITEITAWDALYAFKNSVVNTSFPERTPLLDIVRELINTMSPFGVELGKIGTSLGISGELSRGNSFSGYTGDILRDYFGTHFFVDRMKAYLLGDDECLGPAKTIDSSNGLLGSPRLEEAVLTFEMIFEPELFVAQLVKLRSQTEPQLNADYRVQQLAHRGTISESVCGEVITTVGLNAAEHLAIVEESP